MKDVTLITVNWLQDEAMELMLKSYVAEHYAGEKLNLIIHDNKQDNIGHENGINILYQKVKTKYCLLSDTDIRYTAPIKSYLKYITGNCVAVGEMVGELNAAWGQIKPRLGAWFILFDIEKCRDAGINIFRDPEVTDWSYDVGSWFFEQILKAGFYYHDISRNTDHFDPIAVYDKFIHYGGISWDLTRPEHWNRTREIEEKKELIKKTLQEYSYIDLKDKFI